MYTVSYTHLVRKTGENTYLFDIGQNIAGVPRLTICEPCGTVLTVRCAEEADEEGKLKLNGLNVLYPQVPFQTDRLICDGNPIVWQPKFTYHGFRFIEVEGFTAVSYTHLNAHRGTLLYRQRLA